MRGPGCCVARFLRAVRARSYARLEGTSGACKLFRRRPKGSGEHAQPARGEGKDMISQNHPQRPDSDRQPRRAPQLDLFTRSPTLLVPGSWTWRDECGFGFAGRSGGPTPATVLTRDRDPLTDGREARRLGLFDAAVRTLRTGCPPARFGARASAAVPAPRFRQFLHAPDPARAPCGRAPLRRAHGFPASHTALASALGLTGPFRPVAGRGLPMPRSGWVPGCSIRISRKRRSSPP